MKPRSARHKVTVSALMHSDVVKSDVCILNASARGLLVYAATCPIRASYVELNAGNHIIVGRVVWSKEHHFGLQTQDAVPIDLLPASASAAIGSAIVRPDPTAATFENNRFIARAMQFTFAAIFSLALAVLIFAGIRENLARPLAQIETELMAR